VAVQEGGCTVQSEEPDVAFLPPNTLLAVRRGDDSNSAGIIGRVFDLSGNATTGDFVVNEIEAGWQNIAHPVALSSGRFAVVFHDQFNASVPVKAYVRIVMPDGLCLARRCSWRTLTPSTRALLVPAPHLPAAHRRLGRVPPKAPNSPAFVRLMDQDLVKLGPKVQINDRSDLGTAPLSQCPRWYPAATSWSMYRSRYQPKATGHLRPIPRRGWQSDRASFVCETAIVRTNRTFPPWARTHLVARLLLGCPWARSARDIRSSHNVSMPRPHARSEFALARLRTVVIRAWRCSRTGTSLRAGRFGFGHVRGLAARRYAFPRSLLLALGPGPSNPPSLQVAPPRRRRRRAPLRCLRRHRVRSQCRRAASTAPSPMPCSVVLAHRPHMAHT